MLVALAWGTNSSMHDHPQVVIYNYMKLQQIKAKAALSTGKDLEKMGAGVPWRGVWIAL